MLLRRMIEHVEDQNWFAVVLDFFIVVSGVFLAFQLATWAEERETAQRVDVALVRLHEESEQIVRALDGQTAAFDYLTGLQDRTIAALSTGDVTGIDEATASRGISSLIFYPALTPPRTIYDEVSATGMLTRIEDADVRASIANYYETLAFLQGQIDYFRAGTTATTAEYPGAEVAYDPEAETRMSVRFDLEVLAQSDDTVVELIGLLRNQLTIQREREELRDTAVAMCEALANAVGDTCEREDFSGRVPGSPRPQPPADASED